MVGMALANAIKAMHRTPTFHRIGLPDHSEPLTILEAELDEGTTASVATTVAQAVPDLQCIIDARLLLEAAGNACR